MLVTESSTASLQTVARLVDTGEIKPFIGKTYPLSDVANAWEETRTNHNQGKIVFAVETSASLTGRSAAAYRC